MLNFVRMGLDEKKAGAQMHRARKQMVADLHHRSMVRPATEEFNLAANHDPHDVTSAEHIPTYMNKEYIGNKLAQRLEAEKNSGERRGKHLVAPLVDASNVREIHVRHFDDQLWLSRERYACILFESLGVPNVSIIQNSSIVWNQRR